MAFFSRSWDSIRGRMAKVFRVVIPPTVIPAKMGGFFFAWRKSADVV